MTKTAQIITLKAQKRNLSEKVSSLFENGFIPAVLYGPKISNQILQISEKDFLKILKNKEASSIISLIQEGAEPLNVIVKDIQTHPVSDRVTHLDFQKISMDKEITTTIPLVFEGVSLAVKDHGGVLIKNIDEIEITCLPGNIPESIKVDISKLRTFDDAIKIADLNLSSQLKINFKPEDTIAVVTPPRSEAEIKALDEEIIEDVEAVEGVKKEVKETEESEETGSKETKKEKESKEK
jgi:large subunit ribosomal protein L25